MNEFYPQTFGFEDSSFEALSRLGAKAAEKTVEVDASQYYGDDPLGVNHRPDDERGSNKDVQGYTPRDREQLETD